ncbi:hypothetical protein BCR44DRAFT_70794 [Catenaria anguillulae PL171]|uniref:Uncharacterized protein n=1 Tax=Catenaria anguillulae PL171 TaxID=765915 RepID=A0A1Y2HQ14_9FUNG|nr:hypothetical protein BCR44DRAFT_70794 [Catenaria anguillulae PL171]
MTCHDTRPTIKMKTLSPPAHRRPNNGRPMPDLNCNSNSNSNSNGTSTFSDGSENEADAAPPAPSAAWSDAVHAAHSLRRGLDGCTQDEPLPLSIIVGFVDRIVGALDHCRPATSPHSAGIPPPTESSPAADKDHQPSAIMVAAELQAQIEALQAHNQKVESDLAAASALLAQRTKDLADLSSHLAQSTSMANDLSSKLAATTQQLTTLHPRLAELESQLAQSRTLSATYTSDLAQRDQALDQLRSDLDQQQQHFKVQLAMVEADREHAAKRAELMAQENRFLRRAFETPSDVGYTVPVAEVAPRKRVKVAATTSRHSMPSLPPPVAGLSSGTKSSGRDAVSSSPRAASHRSTALSAPISRPAPAATTSPTVSKAGKAAPASTTGDDMQLDDPPASPPPPAASPRRPRRPSTAHAPAPAPTSTLTAAMLDHLDEPMTQLESDNDMGPSATPTRPRPAAPAHSRHTPQTTVKGSHMHSSPSPTRPSPPTPRRPFASNGSAAQRDVHTRSPAPASRKRTASLAQMDDDPVTSPDLTLDADAAARVAAAGGNRTTTTTAPGAGMTGRAPPPPPLSIVTGPPTGLTVHVKPPGPPAGLGVLRKQPKPLSSVVSSSPLFPSTIRATTTSPSTAHLAPPARRPTALTASSSATLAPAPAAATSSRLAPPISSTASGQRADPMLAYPPSLLASLARPLTQTRLDARGALVIDCPAKVLASTSLDNDNATNGTGTDLHSVADALITSYGASAAKLRARLISRIVHAGGQGVDVGSLKKEGHKVKARVAETVNMLSELAVLPMVVVREVTKGEPGYEGLVARFGEQGKVKDVKVVEVAGVEMVGLEEPRGDKTKVPEVGQREFRVARRWAVVVGSLDRKGLERAMYQPVKMGEGEDDGEGELAGMQDELEGDALDGKGVQQGEDDLSDELDEDVDDDEDDEKMVMEDTDEDEDE